jgi:GTP-binding protein
MEVKSATFVISNTDPTKCPKPNLPEIAFIGRSNVGKSSLINMLSHRTDLAKVSSTPGKTKLINHFLINGNMYWVDLPGYGFAKVGQKDRSAWMKMIWQYVEQRENLLTLFVLIDSRHSPQAIDLAFLQKLGEKGVPFSILFTKADKENQRDVAKNVQEFKTAMLRYWEALPPMFVTSSVKRLGRKQVLTYIGALQAGFFEETAPAQ